MNRARDDLSKERQFDPTRAPDAELVRRAQENLESFVDLYDRYVEDVYRYCSKNLDRAAAEDATSITFLNAINAIRALTPDRHASFRAWLFTIAHNAAIDQLRKQRHLSLDELDIVEPGPSLDERAITTDRRLQLSRAIGDLTGDQRRVVNLRLAGLHNAEISEVMEKSPGAIRILHHRAVVRLRDLLGGSDQNANGRSESK